jgi:alanine racemase
MQYHVTVNISPARFSENIRYLRQRVTPARLCVVMKADAYGHGLQALAPVAVQSGADCIGVCTNNEARIVREQSPDIPPAQTAQRPAG